MSSGRFEEIQRIFHQARKLDTAARPEFLDDACADNTWLREEVESLLRVDSDPAPGFMREPALGAEFRVDAASVQIENPGAAIPESIGQYRIVKLLGVGGMGVVYEAEQEKTGRIVALKVIRPGLTSTVLLRRFEYEAQVLGRLRHEGIAQVYEAGIYVAGGVSVPFIAMELIDGASLLEYVKQESPDVRTLLRLFALICDAVHHAHQKGVVHRDLKPGNILVEHADQSVRPKILDFGIARISDADTLVTTMQTQTGQLLGTIKYMSPEQAAGDPADIDTRSDVYALGVILYELLSGEMPYEVDRKLIHEAVRVIREDEARLLSSVSRLYRGDLTTILGKALEKDKERRIQSASDLAMDIRRYLSDEPITAHPPSATYQMQKFARRNRGLVWSVAIVFVLLLSGIIVTTRQAAMASKARDEAQLARRAEERQRERAERRLDEVRDLVHSLIFEFDAQIRWLAGSTPAREFLVKKALLYLDSLAEDIDPNDVRLQAQLGAAFGQLGDVQGNPSTPNLGDPGGALKSYQSSLRFVQAVADASPAEKGPQQSVGIAFNRIGVLLTSMGRRTEGNDYHQRALLHLENLNRTFPEDIDIRRQLGQCYQIRTNSHDEAGQLDEARIAAMKALAMFNLVIEQDPEDVMGRHAVASISGRLAGILDKQGKPADALGNHQQGLAILEALARDEPHNVVFRRDLGIAAERVGYAYQRSGDFQKALPYFYRAVSSAEALIADDTDYEGVRSDLLVAYIRIGETQLGLGNTAAATEAFRQHLKLCEEHAERNQDDPDAQRKLGVAFYKLAEVATALEEDESLSNRQRQGHARGAAKWLKKCHSVFTSMQEQKILAVSDQGVPDEIAAEIAACNERLAQLKGEAPEVSPE